MLRHEPSLSLSALGDYQPFVPMHRSTNLIRLGFFLLPWLPAYLLSLFGYVAYFAPPPNRYVRVSTFLDSPDGQGTFTPTTQSQRHFASFHVTPALVVLICLLCAFLAGCALLLVGFFRRPKSPPDPRPVA